jgi:hypothetical protein
MLCFQRPRFVISKKEAGSGRQVCGAGVATPKAPTPATDGPPALADQAPGATPGTDSTPADASAPTETIVGAGHRVAAGTDAIEDDDVSLASTVEDFGVDCVMGSVKRVSSGKTSIAPRLHTPKACSPYHRKPHRPCSAPLPAPASGLPQLGCLFALSLLLVGYSWSGAPLGSTTSLLGTLEPAIQGLGSLRSGPSSPNLRSVCVGDARMARAAPTGSLGCVQRTTSSDSALACIDSGCACDMVPMCQAFLTCTLLKDCHVTIANSKRIPCAGRVTVVLTLRGKTVKLCNVLHVPNLEMTLLSVRSHRRRGQGCSFLADHSGCFLAFPNFVLDVDNEDDCVIPCSLTSINAQPDCSEFTQHRA